MTYLKKTLFLLFVILTLNSCSSTVYYTDWHELQITKAETYHVSYFTEIPDGTEAKISYTGNDDNVDLKHVTGKWTMDAVLPSGKKGVFNVNVSSSKLASAKQLVTLLTVNGQAIPNKTRQEEILYFI